MYLNRVKFVQQVHGFVGNNLKIEMGFIRDRGFEGVEAGFNKCELLEMT